MATWKDVRTKIKTKELESKTWISDKKNLLKVIDRAESIGLPPDDANSASISNLRTIIKAAKNAVANDDSDLLSELFRLAAKLPTSDLRLKVGDKLRDIIEYEAPKRSTDIFYKLYITSNQLKRIQESTKQYFQYKKSRKPKEDDE